MDSLRQLWNRVRAFFHKTPLDADLEAEMAAHLEMAIEENVQRGMSPGEARRQAMVRFGGVQQAREKQREARGLPFVDVLAQDVRYGMRQLRKSPGFAVTATLMLALGIGASTAIFGFVDAALIRPLPYAQPNRLVDVDESWPGFPRSNLSRLDYEDWKRMNTTLSSLDVYTSGGFLLRMGSVSEPVPAGRVSDGFFHTLGVEPMLGRDFRPGEDQPTAAKVAILPYGTWMKRFGGRQSVIGQPVILDGDAYTIIGVLPRSFTFSPRGNAEFWVPLGDRNGCESRRSCHDLDGVGRLKDGVTVAQALADLKKVAAQLEKQYPDSNRGGSASVQPLPEFIVGQVRPILLTLLAGAGLLLLIACVNVASLLLVRSESRRREVAVRGALGATPARLIWQFVTEGLLLAAVGGGAGVGVAALTMTLIRKLIPASIAQQATFLGDVGINPHTLLFAACFTVGAAVLMALTPVLRLAFQDIHVALGEGGRGAAGRFWRRLGANLVVVELTVAVVLLAGAGLLGKSLYRLMHVELGMNPEHLATVNLMVPGNPRPEELRTLYREAESRATSLPGVEAVALTSDLPVRCFCDTDWIRIPGRPYHGEHNDVMERDASVDYLHALGAKLREGRWFTDQDDESHPAVTVINATMARKYFPGEDPVGKMIGDIKLSPKSMRQIVGVVDDIREAALDAQPSPAEYFPIERGPDNFFSMVVRTKGDERALLPELVKALRGINPDLGVYLELTMADLIDATPTAMFHQISAWLVGGFAVLALLLSVVGLYGVVAYSVSQRTREIGVRMALGAQRSAVHRLILKEAGVLAAMGIVLGLGCAIGAAALMKTLLFGVEAWDVETLAGVAAMLGGCALLASFIPARRAARVNPVEALRAE